MPRLLFLREMAKQNKSRTKARAKQELRGGKHLRLAFRTPESLRAIFANQLVVQHDASCFYLSFYESFPPLLIGDEKEKNDQLQAIESVPAHCVAKLAVPADRMAKFVEVMAKNVASFQELVQQAMAEAVEKSKTKG